MSVQEAIAAARRAVGRAAAAARAAETEMDTETAAALGKAAAALGKATVAAASAVALAEAESLAAIAAAAASAVLGITQAEAAYELTKSILQDGQIELIPALLALEATAIGEGLAAYAATETAAAATAAAVAAKTEVVFQKVSVAYQADLQQESEAVDDVLVAFQRAQSRVSTRLAAAEAEVEREFLDAN